MTSSIFGKFHCQTSKNNSHLTISKTRLIFLVFRELYSKL